MFPLLPLAKSLCTASSTLERVASAATRLTVTPTPATVTALLSVK